MWCIGRSSYEVLFIYSEGYTGRRYHIYSGIFNTQSRTNNRRNMMSIAYDYSHDAMPVAAAKPKLLLIDGQHVPSLSGRTFKTLNPATEQVIATVAEGNEADVERPWRTMRASERGQILLRLVELMKQHADEIANLESLDAGKPIAGVLRQD